MVAIIKTLQVILALSILIIVHEFGHFIFSKMFGIRVDKFFLFFDAGGKKLLSTKTGWFSKIIPGARNWPRATEPNIPRDSIPKRMRISAMCSSRAASTIGLIL